MPNIKKIYKNGLEYRLAGEANKVFLHKNVVDGVNILTQDMFYKDDEGSRVPNTDSIFCVQHDYNLNGESITIPDGCTLDFENGSIRNGTIVGTDTKINANVEEIFGDDIAISGTWKVPYIYDSWFATNLQTIHNMNNMDNPNIHVDMYIEKVLESNTTVKFESNTDIWLNGKIKNVDTSTSSNNTIVYLNNKENIRIIGGEIIGNKVTNNNVYAHVLNIIGSRHIFVKNVKISNSAGDGIYINGIDIEGTHYYSSDCTISGCTIYNASRCGIAIIEATNCLVENTLIDTVDRHSPTIGIDLEQNLNTENIENITFRNVTIVNCPAGISVTNAHNAYTNNITFEGVNVTLVGSTRYGVSISYATNILFKNCKFALGTTYSYPIRCDDTSSSTTFDGCTIAGRGSYGIRNMTFRNCNLTSNGILINFLEGCEFYNNVMNIGTNFAEQVIGKYVLIGNTITMNNGALAIRTSQNQDVTVKGTIIENNTINISCPYYCIDCLGPIDSFRIKNNNITLNCTGTSSYGGIRLTKASNGEIHNNVFTIVTNRKVFYVESNCSSISLANNRFVLPDGFTAALYTGINLKASTTNRIGDTIFDSGKPIWFNGTGWVDADGNTAT